MEDAIIAVLNENLDARSAMERLIPILTEARPVGVRQLSPAQSAVNEWADASSRVTQRINEVFGANRPKALRLVTHFSEIAYLAVTGQDRGLFAGTVDALRRQASLNTNTQVAVQTITGSDPDEIRRQMRLAAAKETSDDPLYLVYRVESKEAEAVVNRLAGSSIAAKRAIVVLADESETLSTLLAILNGNADFLSPEQFEAATFRFIFPGGFDIRSFVDIDVKGNRFKFYVLFLNMLTPIAVEVESNRIENIKDDLTSLMHA